MNDDGDEINIWLAYSDLFSGIVAISIALLLFHLIPESGNGSGGADDEEVKLRRELQWDVTQRVFEGIRSRGYLSQPDDLKQVRRAFENNVHGDGQLVVFKDSFGQDAVILFRPEGEEQRITFGSQVLFENEGVYRNTIKPEGIALLQSIGGVILSQGHRFSEIRVTGHTDVKPPKYGHSLDYNWMLSSERAIVIVKELLTNPEIGKSLPPNIRREYRLYKRGAVYLNFPPNRISAIGRGEFEPVNSVAGEIWEERQKRIYKSWDDEDAMEQNRRIEIVLRSSPAAFTRTASPKP
ncbi:MAG TPA: OmpA family protein [Pyrinomonadaceae bacterium]|nr:OmpA family protein [Pyrinomonadaceae bacterium]